MLYRIHVQSDKTRFYTEVRSLCKIPYIPAKEMKKRYPDESFIIIGEIGGFACASAAVDKLYVEEGKLVPILPRGSFKKPFEWVTGYTEVQNNHYVAIIGSFFHHLMVIWFFLKKHKVH